MLQHPALHAMIMPGESMGVDGCNLFVVGFNQSEVGSVWTQGVTKNPTNPKNWGCPDSARKYYGLFGFIGTDEWPDLQRKIAKAAGHPSGRARPPGGAGWPLGQSETSGHPPGRHP